MVVVTPNEEVAIKSFRNIPEVQITLIGELNAYDILCNDWIVFSKDSLPITKESN
jgi:large subunit ribosomal protein L4